ncbi:MAG: DUF1269 domain-containing protein [Actinomycetota bacterium]|nr:DUF1269 domain-containing protein [Actinomycetota bacterium]
MNDDSPEDEQTTLVGIAFDDTFRAQEFLTAATRLAARHELDLRDAVFVVSNEDGKVMVRETRDLQTSTSAVSGAVWAGLFGLILGGPVGWLAGTAAGAGAGAITAKVIDHGIPDEWVDWFRQAVAPGTTIVAVLLGRVNTEAVFDELRRFAGARLVYANVPASWQDRMRDALGEQSLGSPDPATVVDAPPPGGGNSTTT